MILFLEKQFHVINMKLDMLEKSIHKQTCNYVSPTDTPNPTGLCKSSGRTYGDMPDNQNAIASQNIQNTNVQSKRSTSSKYDF